MGTTVQGRQVGGYMNGLNGDQTFRAFRAPNVANVKCLVETRFLRPFFAGMQGRITERSVVWRFFRPVRILKGF